MKVYRYEKKMSPSKSSYLQLMYDVFAGWPDPIEMKINDQGQVSSIHFENARIGKRNKQGVKVRKAWSVELLYLADKMGLEVDPKVIEANERSKHNSKLSRNDRSTHKRGKSR